MTEKEKQIVNLFNSGENVTNIYKVTGCSHRSVYKILAKYDIDFPIKKDVLAQKDEIFRLHTKEHLSASDVAKTLHLPKTEVFKLLHKFKAMTPVGKNTKYSCNYNFFDNIDTEQKAYWLGVLYADGNIGSIGNSWYTIISSIDKEWLSKFYEHIEATHVLLREFHKKFQKEIWKVKICNEHMAQSLINLGCVPRKSLLITLPNIPKNLMHHFIRGYFDGDGWVTVATNNSVTKIKTLRSGICSGSKKFLEQISEYIPTKQKAIRPDSNKDLYRLEWSVNDSRIFYDYIYKDATIFLDRKRNKFNSYKQRRSETIIDNPTKD